MPDAPTGAGAGGVMGGLTKKTAGLPMWGWIGLATAAGVVALVWLQSRRAKKDVDTATPVQADLPDYDISQGLATDQYQSLLALLRDLQGEPSTPTPTTPTTPTTGRTAIVNEGNHVDVVVTDLNTKHPGLGLTKEKVKSLNPGIPILPANRRGYISKSNPADAAGGPVVDVFNVITPRLIKIE